MAQNHSSPSPFADIDREPPELAALMLAALQAMAADPQIQRVRRVARQALHPRPEQHLLDAGCGTGEVARELAGDVAPGRVVALDLSATTVAAAAGRHDGSHVTYLKGDVSALDFPDRHFDGVRCERVLQHLSQPDLAIAELIRVTRPGGRVCLVDTDWESMTVDGLPDRLVTAVMEHVYGQVMVHHLSIGRTLRRRLVRAELRDVHATPVTCYFSDVGATASVLPMFDADVAQAIGMIPDELRHEWFAAVDSAAQRDEFLATLTIWVATGTRPT